MASSLIRDSLLNRTTTAALFLVRPESRPENPAFDEQLVQRIEESFRDLAPPWAGFEYHVAGWLATDVNLSRFMNRDMMVFMPLIFTLLITLVSLALRNRWSILLAMVNISVCLIWTLAFLNLIGGAISPITSILPPLIMALAVSDSIHVFNEFLKQDRRQNPLTDVMKTDSGQSCGPLFSDQFHHRHRLCLPCCQRCPADSSFRPRSRWWHDVRIRSFDDPDSLWGCIFCATRLA